LGDTQPYRVAFAVHPTDADLTLILFAHRFPDDYCSGRAAAAAAASQRQPALAPAVMSATRTAQRNHGRSSCHPLRRTALSPLIRQRALPDGCFLSVDSRCPFAPALAKSGFKDFQLDSAAGVFRALCLIHRISSHACQHAGRPSSS
jgi:hypothetical protein